MQFKGEKKFKFYFVIINQIAKIAYRTFFLFSIFFPRYPNPDTEFRVNEPDLKLSGSETLTVTAVFRDPRWSQC
jgi:hypothetical protein